MYKSITPQDMVSAVEQYKYMPQMTENIAGITTNEVYSNVFVKDRKVMPTAKYFDRSSTKTITVVTYSTDEGQAIPIGTKTIKAGEFEPQAIKMIKSYTPTILNELAEVEHKTKAQIVKEDIGDFIKTRDENVKNQCHEVFASGTITYPMRNIDGKIVTADQIDYTDYFGSIVTLTTSSTECNVVQWNSASTTQDEIWRSIISIIKYLRSQTNNKYFMNMKDIVIFAEDTAYNALASVAPQDFNSKLLHEDGMDYLIGGKNGIRIISTNMPYKGWVFSANKWSLSSTNALTTGQIVILDKKMGNFKLRDMKYLSIKTAGEAVAVPYEITTKILDYNSGMAVHFATKPLVIANTEAFAKITVTA